jgi:hypothetical protein
MERIFDKAAVSDNMDILDDNMQSNLRPGKGRRGPSRNIV